MKYVKQLDSLRAIAVLLVIVQHWSPFDFTDFFEPGAIGVTAFFVLSGFLITQILLEGKTCVEKGTKKVFVLRQFYIRRFLRIFPIYYLTLILLKLMPVEQRDLTPHVCYVSNFYMFNMQNWDGMLSHFWSLAVEEQFYLLWPFLILFIPLKHIKKTFIAFIIFGISSRALIVLLGKDLSWVLTPSNFDAFALGGFFSYMKSFEANKLKKFNKGIEVLAMLSLPSFIIILFAPDIVIDLFMRTLIAILALYMIVRLDKGLTGIKGRVFNNPALLHVGKTSYAIYIFHNIIPHYIATVFPSVHWYLVIIISFAVLISITSLSWFLYEKPINDLKRFFSYYQIPEKRPKVFLHGYFLRRG